MILSESSTGAEVPFFETWIQTCMPEEGKILNPDHPCFRPDSTKVESLVALLNNSSEMKLVSVAWAPTPRTVVGTAPSPSQPISCSPVVIFFLPSHPCRQMNWHEACLSISAAILEILNAWENGVLAFESIQVAPPFQQPSLFPGTQSQSLIACYIL